MRRGQLRIYLGAAPGVGKTFAMLDEGRRRAERGTDVVIGLVETHGRKNTQSQIGDLEIVARRSIAYRGSVFEEMDVDAILQRAPQVALVDELAHTNVPGSLHEKRWQDVDQLLDAGIDVISTVNIQHLESMNDVVESITGIKQAETVPDEFVRRAEQVEIVDATPEALRRRMAHGNIYPAERIDAAMSNYFRVGNLGALRELALMWVADTVDDALQAYRTAHGIADPWETRERIVVALTGAPHGADLIRRAARLAARVHGEIVGVHVRAADGLARASTASLIEQRELIAGLGGAYHEIAGGDVPLALTQFARSQNATQIVLGGSHRSRLSVIVNGSVINDVIRRAADVDVHVIDVPTGESSESARARNHLVRARRAHLVFSRRRMVAAWIAAILAPLALTGVLVQVRDNLSVGTDLLPFFVVVVAVAAIGGIEPAAAAAVTSFLLTNYFLVPPIHTWTVNEPENLLALFTFVFVGIVVGAFVSVSARRTADAALARSDAETLAALAATIGSDDDPLQAVIEQIRDVFDADAVSVLRTVEENWVVDAATGIDPPTHPSDGQLVIDLVPGSVVVLRNAVRENADLSILRAFVTQLGVAVERRSLRSDAADAARLLAVNNLRSALLAAVSHDLRTPLASIKAAASSLRQPDIEWSQADRAELLETIEVSTDRLADLVTNLLGMSRIQAGTVQLSNRPVDVEDVVARAVVGLDLRGNTVQIEVAEGIPAVVADAALLERAIANLIDNALKWSPAGRPVVARADVHGDRVVIMIVDHGPGIAVADRDRVFEPFQRSGDQRSVEGTGLGLAVARGFIEIMKGSIEIEDTPAGGTTMVVSLPVAP